MIWIQGLTCFALWIASGVLQMRRSMEIKHWAESLPRITRTLMAVAWMVGGIVPVFLVLIDALQNKGFGNNGMTPIVWLLVAGFGLLFVHGQTLGTALLVTLVQDSALSESEPGDAVTASPSQTSSTISSQENDHDEAPHS